MIRFVLWSWIYLFYFEALMHVRGFEAVHRAVHNCPARSTHSAQITAAEICRAMDIACVLCPKRILCLQRSAATAMLLRRFGWNAEMVIGAQILPFQSHAWVEIDHHVVNDKPYIRQVFPVLARY